MAVTAFLGRRGVCTGTAGGSTRLLALDRDKIRETP